MELALFLGGVWSVVGLFILLTGDQADFWDEGRG